MAAWGIVLAAGIATAVALLAPWPFAAALALGGLALAPRRRALVGLAALTLAVNAAASALALDAPPAEGALRGLEGGARLLGALFVNVALLARVGASRLLEGLRLPPRASTLVAAVLLAAADLGRDFARLRDARRLEGAWPSGRVAAARAAASLLPSLFVAAERRSVDRADALRLAGHDAPPWFVPVVAVAALAAAGRLALLAVPNVALTFVVAFLGGMVFGARVGALGAALGMLLTDLMLTGLYPLGLVNVPAMALVALGGAALRRVDLVGASGADRVAGRIFAFALGVAATLAFSVAADTLTWLVIAPGSPGTWRVLVLAGLVFNVLPALANGVIFAASVGPVSRAFRALRSGGREGPAPREPALPAEATRPPA